jgi:GNAT superfamily N-acetyltransferase
LTEIIKQKPKANELAAMYIQAGWMSTADPEKMSRAVESDSQWFVARDEAGKLLGLGRFITDYARYAIIVDVIVDSDQQGKGIGTAIMNSIISACRELGIDSVNLWPSKGKIPFYERFGFYALPPDQPHMKLKM